MQNKITRRILALYLGCEAQFTDLNPVSAARTFIARIEGVDIENLSKWDVKPILRPLSDISESELNQVFKAANEVELNQPYSIALTEAAKVDYLLSNGFDLFNLIPAGLAFDKSKGPSEIEAV